MLRRRRILAAAALAAAGTTVGSAPARAATTPYQITAPAAATLGVAPTDTGAGGAFSLTITQAGGTTTFAPAAQATPAGSGCTSTAAATTCPSAAHATRLTVRALVIAVSLKGVVTQNLAVSGGSDADTITVADASISSALTLTTGGGADRIDLSGPAGSIASLADTTSTDNGSDVWTVAVPGLQGTLDLGGGNDRVDAPGTDLALDGDDGDDLLSTGGAIDGGLGDDTLRPSDPTGQVQGGPGNDLVSFAGTTTPLDLRLQGGSIQVNGAPAPSITGVEGLEGGDGPDRITGDAGANVLSGGAGDDVIQGGGGADAINGGSGTDTISFADVTDTAGVVVDLPAGRAGTRSALGTALSIEAVVGSPESDTITGTAAPEVIQAGAGDDTITAGGGNDTVDAGPGAATVDLGPGNDTVTSDLAGAFADQVTGGSGDDTIRTGPGNDTIRPGTGNDTVDAGDGEDTVSYDDRAYTTPVTVTLGAGGSAGSPGETDRLTGVEDAAGTPGDDSITGDDGPNALSGGDGNDTLLGLGGADTLDGGADHDILDGGAGPDVLRGGTEDDRLLAFDGFADSVDCGAGNDDTEYDAVDTLTSCENAVRPDKAVANDADGDGVAADRDCNDRDPTIFPGAVDVPGDKIDQDCSGIDRLLPPITTKLKTYYNVDPKTRLTTVLKLAALGLPPKATVKLSCEVIARLRGIKKAKRGCPFSTKSVRPRGTVRTLTLVGLLKHYRLPPGTRLDIVISAPGYESKFIRLTTKNYSIPSMQNACLPAGAKQPQACPTRLN